MDCPYANVLLSEASDLETAVLLGVFERVGLSKFLQQNPLAQLELQQQVLHNGYVVNGIYSYATKTAEVTLTRDVTEFGATYQKQQFWSISSLATTSQEAIQRTLIHEVGHHIHNVLREHDIALFRQVGLYPRSNAISQYATRDKNEYFAESFAAYVYQRIELLVDDSLGYAMISQSLESLGLYVKES